MNRRLLTLGLVLVALALLALGWMSRHSFVREPTELEVGMQGEALENRTLLLQKWLEASGRPVTRRGGDLVTKDLPRQGTLILLHVSAPVSAAEAADLLAWVRQGGCLLTDGSVAPFNDERGLAALHAALAVRLADRRTGTHLPASRSLPSKATYGKETPYRVTWSNAWRLYPDRLEDWPDWMGHDESYNYLSRPEGSGRLILTADLGFVHDDSLTENDHAAYLERILTLEPTKGPVVVWSKPVERSLFLWLWAHARPPCVGLLLLLAAWIWKSWGRFGPLLQEPPLQRRSLREHLRAAARFAWDGGAGAHLVRRAREAVEQRAARLNPAYPALEPGARADWLAQASGGDPSIIFTALDDRPGRTAQHLAQDLVTLERLWQRLKTPLSPQDTP